MAATNMKLAGLEVGCKASRIGHPGYVVDLSPEEPCVFFSLYGEVNVTNPVWCETKDIIRDSEDAHKARQARFEVLYERFPGEAGVPEESDTIERYCCVQYNADGDDGMHAFHFGDTFEEAVQYVGGEVLEGWEPEGVYDLDTGKKIDVHISSPVITPSEDQGATINPLDPVTA